MPRKIGIEEARQKAGRFCAYRERSPGEAEDKLKSWGLSPEQREEIIQFLIRENYLNEERFAMAYCHDKFEFNSWGKLKIKAGIFIHRLPDEVVETGLRNIDPDKYRKRALELAQKKWDSLESETEIKRIQKTTAYMAAKGFEAELVREIVSKELKGHPN